MQTLQENIASPQNTQFEVETSFHTQRPERYLPKSKKYGLPGQAFGFDW